MLTLHWKTLLLMLLVTMLQTKQGPVIVPSYVKVDCIQNCQSSVTKLKFLHICRVYFFSKFVWWYILIIGLFHMTSAKSDGGTTQWVALHQDDVKCFSWCDHTISGSLVQSTAYECSSVYNVCWSSVTLLHSNYLHLAWLIHLLTPCERILYSAYLGFRTVFKHYSLSYMNR